MLAQLARLWSAAALLPVQNMAPKKVNTLQTQAQKKRKKNLFADNEIETETLAVSKPYHWNIDSKNNSSRKLYKEVFGKLWAICYYLFE